MKLTNLQKLGAGALTTLALICLMAPAAMAQLITPGGPSGPGTGVGSSIPSYVAYFDGALIDDTLANSLANSTLLSWDHCKYNNGGYVDDCIILYEQTAATTIAVRQISSTPCPDNTNETCQNNRRIRYQAIVDINEVYVSGVQSFDATITASKHSLSFRPFQHQLTPLGEGVLHDEDTLINQDIFGPTGTPLYSNSQTISIDEEFKCADCHRYAVETLSNVIANLISNGILVDTHTLPTSSTQYLGDALTNGAARTAFENLFSANNMTDLVDFQCQLSCDLLDIDEDQFDEDPGESEGD